MFKVDCSVTSFFKQKQCAVPVMFYNLACTRDALLIKKNLPFKMNLIVLMIYAVHGHVNFAALDYHGCCYRIFLLFYIFK